MTKGSVKLVFVAASALGMTMGLAVHADNSKQAATSHMEKKPANSKEEFVDAMKDRYVDIETKMEKLGDKISRTSGRSKDNLQAQWEDLTTDRSKLQKKMDEFSRSTKKNWKSAKASIEDGMTELEGKIKKASN